MHPDGRDPRSRFTAFVAVIVVVLGLTAAVVVAQQDERTTVSTSDETSDAGTTTPTTAPAPSGGRTTTDGTTLTIEKIRSGTAPCEVLDVTLTAANPAWNGDVVTTAQVVGRPERFQAVPLQVVNADPNATVALVVTGPDVDEILLAVGSVVDRVDADDPVVALAVPARGDAAVQWNAGDAAGAASERGNGQFVAPGCQPPLPAEHDAPVDRDDAESEIRSAFLQEMRARFASAAKRTAIEISGVSFQGPRRASVRYEITTPALPPESRIGQAVLDDGVWRVASVEPS